MGYQDSQILEACVRENAQLELFQMMCLLLLMSSHQSELAFVFSLWHREQDWCYGKSEPNGPLATETENKIALPITVGCLTDTYWIIHTVHPDLFHLKYTVVFSSPNYLPAIHWISNDRCIKNGMVKVEGYLF